MVLRLAQVAVTVALWGYVVHLWLLALVVGA